jgi:PleD family two-component response regulator
VRSAVRLDRSFLRCALNRPGLWTHRAMSKNTYKPDAPPVVGVVDPDPVARNGLRTLLRGYGIDVSTFDSAESFLLASNGRHIGCLIVDLLLPGMSGL